MGRLLHSIRPNRQQLVGFYESARKQGFDINKALTLPPEQLAVALKL
jgi:hypothetical protein